MARNLPASYPHVSSIISVAVYQVWCFFPILFLRSPRHRQTYSEHIVYPFNPLDPRGLFSQTIFSTIILRAPYVGALHAAQSLEGGSGGPEGETLQYLRHHLAGVRGEQAL